VNAQYTLAETTPDLPLEIAHVLLIDVVGYSKLLVNEQIELLQELNQIVRGTQSFRAAEASGKLKRVADGRRDGCIKDYKRFNKANRSATGQVVEVDPGELGHPGPDGDAGQPPSSHYQFNVNGITYDGWLKDELGEGEKVLVRYNSSNPEFNHADGDQPFWRDHSHAVWFIAFAIVAWSLVKVVRDRDFLREDSF
jgi:hypothetical protein